jgi:hypothetical protein
MATQQEEGGVPFSIAHEMQQFRLLELPQEIVELLEAPNPPELSIKSQTTASAGAAVDPKPAYAVLCTPTKTFQLRQVQTSNSLFVTQYALEAHGNQAPAATTRAIASCTATLELHPSVGSPVALLDEVLPLYDVVDGEVDAAGNGKSKAIIFPDLPFSDAECEQAWATLMAFEFGGSSYRPSANTLSHVWSSINAAAVAEGVNLDQQFLVDDIASAVAEEGHPGTLATAILRALAADDQDKKGSWSCLDRTKTVQFVGKTLLEAKRDGKDFLTAEFLDAWKDSLPESWREEAELKTIDGFYELPSATTVRLKGSAVATPTTNTTTSKAASSSRKWHEKFGRARKR